MSQILERKLLKKEGLNVEDLIIACLLHDVSYCTPFKTQDEWQNHGRVSSKMVRTFLESIDYPKERIHDICYAMFRVVFLGGVWWGGK